MASLGSAPGIMLGVGVGSAAAAALEPLIEPGRQQAWKDHPNRVLDPGRMAALVAQGAVELGVGQEQASREGLAADKFNRLVYLVQRMPDYGTLKQLANRGLLGSGQVPEALNRHAYPADWHKPLTDLFSEILSPGEIAAAIHRGLIPDPGGLLKGQQPTPPFTVESYPVYDIHALEEAAGHGFDRDRLGVLVGLQGLPMGPHEAAQAEFRQIITFGDYIRAFNESNNRNEWAQAIYEQTRQIPTARDFLENALRGYRDLPAAIKGAALHGMTPEHATLIYQNQGRPMNIRQITQALARGATFHPEPGEITDPYHAATVEGPIKPAYYEMFESLKYTLPSAFVMRSLAETGVWSEAKVAERLKWAGWFPQDADEAAAAWAKTGTAAPHPNPWVKTQQTRLMTAMHAASVKRGVARPALEQYMEPIVGDLADRDAIFQLWADERAVAALA